MAKKKSRTLVGRFFSFLLTLIAFAIGLGIAVYLVDLYIKLGEYDISVPVYEDEYYIPSTNQNVNRGGNTCGPGFCWSNGSCCPSTSRFYCEGGCYPSAQDAQIASQGRCLTFRVNC